MPFFARTTHLLSFSLLVATFSIITMVARAPSTAHGSHTSFDKRAESDPYVYPRKDSVFSPLLPSAIALAVKSPYLSAWLATGQEGGNGGYLAGRWPQFWPLQFSQSPSVSKLEWAGLIRVNGRAYQFMGAPNDDNIGNGNLQANQLSLNITSSRSIFVFEAAQVKFQVTFLSTLPTGNDLLRHSLPFSYLSIELLQSESSSSHGHDEIAVYTDIGSEWASGDPNAEAKWSLDDSSHSVVYEVGRKYPLPFDERNEFAEWGRTIYATNKASGLTTASGKASELRKQFTAMGKLNGVQDQDYRVISDRSVGFGFALPLAQGQPAVFAIGHVRDPYIQSLEKVEGSNHSSVMVEKWGYWRYQFQGAKDAVEFFLNDYSKAILASREIDQRIYADAIKMGGDGYAAIVSLSARQALGGTEVTIGKDSSGRFDLGDVAAFMKGLSSNGDMSAVDMLFQQSPILLYLEPTLLKLSLEPILKYSESGLYPNLWTVHDLGKYPRATGHNDGKDGAMPLEESGNVLIMMLTYHQVTKDAAFLTKHYKILQQWAQFLVDGGLNPVEQSTADSIAGALEKQTNLALKAIIGIRAMSEIARITGDENTASKMASVAQDYISKWMKLAVSSDSTHTKLAYQLNDSWSMLYNLFADRLLNLKLVPKSIYEMQDKFYPSVSNMYGVPLDSRVTWTTTYWQVFTAGASTSIQTRDLFINNLVKYVEANRVTGAFPDVYETKTAQFMGRSADSTRSINFLNRPVVGGHFALLALEKANQANGVKEYPFQ